MSSVLSHDSSFLSKKPDCNTNLWMQYQFGRHWAVFAANVWQEFSTSQLIQIICCEFVMAKIVSHSHSLEVWIGFRMDLILPKNHCKQCCFEMWVIWSCVGEIPRSDTILLIEILKKIVNALTSLQKPILFFSNKKSCHISLTMIVCLYYFLLSHIPPKSAGSNKKKNLSIFTRVPVLINSVLWTLEIYSLEASSLPSLLV